ncbi:MAG: methyltransferase domain-containing protein [Nanoarchaeota archaeon]
MDFYKLISKGYDELYGEEQKVKHDIIKASLNIKNDDLLLDVGCGIGYPFNCEAVGIDTSMELLQQNRQNNDKNDYNPIDKILAKAENLPFKDNVFDKVISVTSMHNFDDFEKGISEIKRVGKKDFAFSILKKAKNFEPIEREIRNNFSIEKIINAKQDWIFICSKVFK